VVDFNQILKEFIDVNPTLVLLDINLPRYDGFYWCRQIRTISNVPIIYLSARSGDMDQVMAIENGGDDYITKPFSAELVLAKIKGLLRRTYGEYSLGQKTLLLDVDGLLLHYDQHSIEFQEKKCDLTGKEFTLLEMLMKSAGSFVTREAILEALWDDVAFVDDNTLSVNMTRVRKKLQELGIENAVETLRGKGYRLNSVWGDKR
jgi:two-component system, OmpR family, response regulator